MKNFIIVFGFFLFGCCSSLRAQDVTPEVSFFGDVRIAQNGSADSFQFVGDQSTVMRFRPGVNVAITGESYFRGRIAYLLSNEFESVKFELQADGGYGLADGTASFDQLYYGYKSQGKEFKIGRFQESNKTASNSGRSIDRFQSNNVNVHWTDGIYYSQMLNNDWRGEALVEYINRNHRPYTFRPPITFEEREHNVGFYMGVENGARDRFNIIQKEMGIHFYPGAYLGGDSYIALNARTAIDLPSNNLKGGTWRFAGEIGQNVSAEEFGDGMVTIISVGVNKFAGKHHLMFEFTKVGAEWVVAPTYAPGSDEIEMRYTYLLNNALSMDVRYRVRSFGGSDLVYGTFTRVTYKF